MAEKAETAPSKQRKMTLSITFQGPFLFDFKDSPKEDPTVDVYAPYCPFHEAGIFFGDNALSETDLYNVAVAAAGTISSQALFRSYFISGPGVDSCLDVPNQIYPVRPPHRAVSIYNDPFLKPLDSENPQIDTDKVMFHFNIPRPSHIYPIYCDVVDLVRGFDTDPGAEMQIYATGLRLLYAWDTTTKIYLYAPGTNPTSNTPQSVGVHDITPAAAGNCDLLPEQGAIDIRYQGIELQDRNDPHADARSCLASLATMAGSTEWWLNYGDGKSSPTNTSRPYKPIKQVESYTGGDCGAPVIGHRIPIQSNQ
jgi:hypothetical protein